MPRDLYLHQEILLLALRDDTGTVIGGMVHYALAGAMVSELLLRQRIIANDDKRQTVAVVDETPVGDAMLDHLLEMVARSGKHFGMRDWVLKAAHIRQLHHRIAESLCDKGILEQDDKKVMFVFTRKVYPEVDGTCEDHLRERLASVMFHEEVKPDERTAVLIAIANHAGLLNWNFPPVELKQHKQRIRDLSTGKILASEATASAITAMQSAMMAAAMVPVIMASTHS
jgi:hypothetical protein